MNAKEITIEQGNGLPRVKHLVKLLKINLTGGSSQLQQCTIGRTQMNMEYLESIVKLMMIQTTQSMAV
ncbi:MAG: hypothetical protein B6D72_05615 [gamma proteobacterium symbiont of Ctena orbiculata]|nr:MAG: hypothetical protein B6D72_05615 [gamma proteobacterium symbiont of Ctena orbiculata]